jgi:shikimate kinase
VIYLHAEPSTLWGRIRYSRNRPLLQTADPMGRLAELYAQRDALYRETADHVVESERSEVMRLMRLFEVVQQHDGN